MPFRYPPAARLDVVDDYHGTEVADPYRWLEDADTAETLTFVAAQNRLARSHLDGLEERQRMTERMRELWDVERLGLPHRRGTITTWPANNGLQEQASHYIEVDGESPRVILDPNELASDGTVAILDTSLSPDGSMLGYSTAEAGSDWQEIRIRDVATGTDLGDLIRHVKFTTISWHAKGFFYARFPEVDHDSTETVRDPYVCFHQVGTDQSADLVIFRNEDNPDLSYSPSVTDDDKFLLLTEWLGTSHKSGVLALDLQDPDARWRRILPSGEAMYTAVHHEAGELFIHTDRAAPNGAIIAIQIDNPTQTRVVVPEGPDPIETVAAAAGRLLVVRLVDAQHEIDTFGLDGAALGPIDLSQRGTVAGISGTWADSAVFIAHQSFAHPPTAWRWEEGELARIGNSAPPVDPGSVSVERRVAISTDGAEVAMFLVRMPGTSLPAPTELYGYGGFEINMTPLFDPARLAFLDAGGVVIIANLRGGSERGESWHTQGMLGNKQQVFDDYIACAEHLIDTGVTTTPQLGIRGRSNGGLLTAAVMIQRPELFGAVISTVPVTDMLRYQHFTAGRYWTVEYGDAADPDAFEWLIRYSPIHNVSENAEYPPLLITTGESDDRVVPMHSYKLAAEIQHAAGGGSDQPYLLRIDSRAGHGLGKPTSKLIEESADVYGFLLHHLSRGGSTGG